MMTLNAATAVTVFMSMVNYEHIYITILNAIAAIAICITMPEKEVIHIPDIPRNEETKVENKFDDE